MSGQAFLDHSDCFKSGRLFHEWPWLLKRRLGVGYRSDHHRPVIQVDCNRNERRHFYRSPGLKVAKREDVAVVASSNLTCERSTRKRDGRQRVGPSVITELLESPSSVVSTAADPNPPGRRPSGNLPQRPPSGAGHLPTRRALQFLGSLWTSSLIDRRPLWRLIHFATSARQQCIGPQEGKIPGSAASLVSSHCQYRRCADAGAGHRQHDRRALPRP